MTIIPGRTGIPFPGGEKADLIAALLCGRALTS